MTPFALATFPELVPMKLYAGDWIGAIPSYKRESARRRLVPSLRTVRAIALSSLRGAVGLAGIIFASSVMAESGPSSAAPAVGVVTVERRPMTDSYEFNGRIQAINSVNIVRACHGLVGQTTLRGRHRRQEGRSALHARNTPVPGGRRPPEGCGRAGRGRSSKRQHRALARAAASREKCRYPAGLDNAEASQRVAAAQLKAAQAQLETAQIDLDYTDIHSPIDGRIGRTSVTDWATWSARHPVP